VFNAHGLTEEACYAFSQGAGETLEHKSLLELVELVLQTYTGETSVAFVDATAGKEDLKDFHMYVMENTPFSIVTANKNPIALFDYNTFKVLTEDIRRYDFRCSVMAGAEAVRLLQDLNDVGDQPTLIQGVFSGTLAYICSELGEGHTFSGVVRDAFAQGFTEPDVRDDLNGFDVARKLLVLARISGFDVDMQDIKVEPFVPQSYFEADSNEAFLESLSNLDAYFKSTFSDSKKGGKTRRYVAECVMESGRPKLTVGWKDVVIDSALGRMKGSTNKLIVCSKGYPSETPYVVEAPGAGRMVTALNVRRGLLHVLPARRTK
jgi:aspartokinase/homoserine dehydrogenase 1